MSSSKSNRMRCIELRIWQPWGGGSVSQQKKECDETTVGTTDPAATSSVLLLPWDKLWAFIGLWTMLDWIYWFNRTPLRNGLSNDWPIGIYSAMTVFMGIAFLLFKSRGNGNQSKTGVKIDQIMAFLTIACVISTAVNGYLANNMTWDCINSVIAGLCMTWGYLRWAQQYSTMCLRNVVACLCTAYFAGSGFKIIFDAVSGPIGAFIAALLPLVCLLSLRQVESREIPAPIERGEVLYRPGTFRPLMRVLFWLFIFMIIARYCIGDRPWASMNEGILGHLLEVCLAGFALLWIFRWDKPIDFPMLWRFAFLFFSLAIVCKELPWAWGDQALRCFNQVAVSLVVMLLWLLLVDISHHCSWHPCATFSLGWAAYVGSRWAAQTLGYLVPFFSLGSAGNIASLWILAIIVLFSLSSNNPHVRRFFADLQPPIAKSVRYSTLDERCESWGGEYGLTSREIDVLQLLARGYSKGYIADALSLSENTVRNHVKHIYDKTGIHGKDGLRSALDG